MREREGNGLLKLLSLYQEVHNNNNKNRTRVVVPDSLERDRKLLERDCHAKRREGKGREGGTKLPNLFPRK